MAYIKLRNMPNQHKTGVLDFSVLNGGLNIREMDYLLPKNQSPEMQNLWWRDGVLQCRDGQTYVATNPDEGAQGFTCCPTPFWGYLFLHIGAGLYCHKLTDTVSESTVVPELEALELPEGTNLAANRGTFFRFGDWLMYKNGGAYLKIIYHAPGGTETEPTFEVADMLTDAYVPVIAINADPATGSGDLYQPENRLSAKKTIWYNVGTTKTYSAVAAGSAEFVLGMAVSDTLTGVVSVYAGSMLISPTAYTVDKANKKITLSDAPVTGTQMTFIVWVGAGAYKLPVAGTGTTIEKVEVDGATVTGWSFDTTTATVTVPNVTATNPPTNNTVRITYSKENTDAKNSILDCPYAFVFKSASDLCILMGGSTKQPNAFFWSGNSDVAMDASYFPMDYYNLAGDTDDPVTGFGTQYSSYILFKEHQLGKIDYSLETIDGRNNISFTYTILNSVNGCDLPWTIQTVENNLVWCNTYAGVQFLQAATPAYENNVVSLSQNIDGSPTKAGLLAALQSATPEVICAFDDGTSYWLCVGGEKKLVYLWDYRASAPANPSWFPQTNIAAVAFALDGQTLYHLNAEGKLTRFVRSWMDYTDAIEKVYRFPPQWFGTYDRLKDVMSVLITVRADTNSQVTIEYLTDYEIRKDETDASPSGWHLVPRNLTFRSLATQPFAYTARRTTNCRHVRHFSMRLSNNIAAEDLAIVSVQMNYRLLGRTR